MSFAYSLDYRLLNNNIRLKLDYSLASTIFICFGISPASTKCTNGATDKLLQVRSLRLGSSGTSTPPRVARARSSPLVSFMRVGHWWHEM